LQFRVRFAFESWKTTLVFRTWVVEF
jgi:hypothetical protein